MLTRPPFAASTQPHSQQRSFSNIETIRQSQTAQLANSRLKHVRSVSGPYPGSTALRHSASMEITDDIEIDDLDALRPKKRARFEPTDTVASPQTYTQDEDALHEVVNGEALGLPMRPVESLKRQHARQSLGENAARKADGLKPPAIATRIPPPKCVADFSPWNGKHSEDILNEQVVRTGYSEKGPSPNQNESNTARLTIWPSLSQKNNLALHTLSLLYTQVLEKRQVLGRCTAPSSFKPPPRVTVTDTKREAWLRDLANPNVQLRRQSRTIPHGIRGKLLLEQCVAKAVPLQRAVWLAKCVGANELRAFKRKGVNGNAGSQGEAKWIREWTMSVEQFLAETIKSSNQQGWRAKIEYAVKLVTAIYTENLLEADHFLDCIVASLSSSLLDQAPSWMLLTQIFWRDIVSFSRRGRLLAKALLKRLHEVNEGGHTIETVLRTHLRKQLGTMVSTAPTCLVLPDEWEAYGSLIEEIASNDVQAQTEFDSIRARNERLLQSSTKSYTAYCHPTVRLFEVLDHVSLDVDIDRLAQQCMSILFTSLDLVAALLSWTSTRYRHGNHRVVLAEQLIMTLHRSGIDTDSAILSFLASEKLTSAIDAQKVYAVIVSLIRRDSFSAGRYLKWLITSGAISANDSMNLARGLLMELPDKCLPQHLKNTRTSLLSRLEDDHVLTTITNTKEAKLMLERSLSDPSNATPTYALLQSPLLERSELADWAYTNLNSIDKDSHMTLHTFCIFCNVFEMCNYMDGLTALLRTASLTEDFILLASLADTIDAHALEFTIAATLTGLTDGLRERYRMLRTQQPLEKTSIIAMKSLFSRLPDMAAFNSLLDNDLMIFERQTLSAVCSPASDNIVGMHAGTMETDDEIEAVFASGNTMDEAVMQRVFLRIVQSAEKPSIVTTSSSAPCRWLLHMRSLDQATFETIVGTYVSNLMSSETQHTPPRVLYMLVAADCCTLDNMISCRQRDSSDSSASMLCSLLAAPLADGLALSGPERYRLQQKRVCYCQRYPDIVEDLLGRAITYHDPGTPWILELKVLLQTNTAEPLPLFRQKGLFEAVLRVYDHDIFGNEDITLSNVVANANALNVAFCVGWLNSRVPGPGITRTPFIYAATQDSPVWPILLQAAPDSMVREIHTWALEQQLKEGDSTCDQKLIDILDVTHSVLKLNADPALLSTLTTSLKTLAKSLGAEHNKLDQLLTQLKTLLHIIILYRPTTREGDANAQGRAYVVFALMSIMSLPIVETDHALLVYITDVASTLIDRLPSEIIARMAKSAQTANLNDRAIVACFGHVAQPDSWLSLATAVNPATSAQSRTHLKAGAAPLQVATSRSAQASGQLQQGVKTSGSRQSQQNVELKYAPFPLRRWEVIPGLASAPGENDSSISLALFGARKA